MERPAKLIRSAVQEEDDDGDSEITVNDVKNCRDNVERSAGHYRKHGNKVDKPLTCLDVCLSARIREKTCIVMRLTKHFVVFSTRTNLDTLCNADIVLRDGTFKSSPKHFYHLYTSLVYVNFIAFLLSMLC